MNVESTLTVIALLPQLLAGQRLQFQAARRSAAYGCAMSQGSDRRQWATDVAGRQKRRDRSSGRKDGPAVRPAQVSIGNAMANRRPSRCDCRRCIETGEAAPSLRQTASRCGAPASPSGGIFRCRPSSTAAAAHGCRPARKRPLVERSPEAASLRVRSIPGSQYRQDLPAGRSLSDRCSGSGHHSPVAINRNTHRIPRSPGRLSTRPTVPLVSSSPHSLDTPLHTGRPEQLQTWILVNAVGSALALRKARAESRKRRLIRTPPTEGRRRCQVGGLSTASVSSGSGRRV